MGYKTPAAQSKGKAAVARPARAGRGLKQRQILDQRAEGLVARPTWAGRGLKPFQTTGFAIARMSPGPRGPGAD